jgi:hypothetical protein
MNPLRTKFMKYFMLKNKNTSLSNFLHETLLCQVLSVSARRDVESLWGRNSRKRGQNSCEVMDKVLFYT